MRKHKPIYAWHFVGKTLRDGTPIPRDGVELIFRGAPILCKQGLHASKQPWDALKYAPGNTLCYVKCEGDIVLDVDKLVCTKRTIIARMDTGEMMDFFIRMQALSVPHLYPNCMDDSIIDYLMFGTKSNIIKKHVVKWFAYDASRTARKDFNELIYECFENVMVKK